MIVKNEEKNLRRCLESVRPHVDEICIVDTGSTDSTPNIAREFADKFEVFTGCNDSDGKIASFSVARQRSFDLATRPWIFWIDGDDEVVGADKLGVVIDELDRRRGGGPAFAMFPYEYSHDDQGNVTCLHYRERIISSKKDFVWKSPVHEVLTPLHSSTCIELDFVKTVHRRQTSGKVMEGGRNLRILKKHYDVEGESDVRMLYYLGLEYGNVGQLGNAIRFHKRYVELSGWDDERFLACLKIAEHYQTFGDYVSAIEWAKTALTVREGWAEAFFSLGRSYYFLAQQGGPQSKRNWERSATFIKIGLQLPPTKTVLFVNPMERAFEIHNYLNFALNAINDTAGALESVETALRSRPGDENMLLNQRVYKEYLAKERIRSTMGDLGMSPSDIEGFMRSLDAPKSQPVAPAVPVSPSSYSPDSYVRSIDPGPDGNLDIVFYVGTGCEPWTPADVAAGGIGGSETMAMEMARRLSKLGHTIRLYGDCAGKEGVYDGVHYLHENKYRDVVCDVLVTSRRPHAVDSGHNIQARTTVCWVHDVHLGRSLTHDRALKIDKFFTLTQWHKGNLLDAHRCIHPDQVMVTRNGIDFSRFEGKDLVRNPHRAVYSSSPDRGLWTALQCWPRIRAIVPDAELHVFYGFHTWEMTAAANNDQGQLDLIKGVKLAMEEQSGKGVFFHGRVDQDRLASEFLQSGVWAYPTWFSETSCITAMEAQAAGCRIVTSPIAALNETVGPRGTMVYGDWLSAPYHDDFVGAVVSAMTRPEDGDRQTMIDHAKENFSLDRLAEDWTKMLRDLVQSSPGSVVPYKRAS